MRLIDLLGSLDDESIERLSERHLGSGEPESRSELCVNLESELKSPKHLRDVVYNLQPPAFTVLTELIDAAEHRIPLAGLRELATERTNQLSERVTAGAVAGRQETRLYRRVLLEARRSDLELDASETALLRVLRRELGLRQIDHFLIEHHDEMRQFWNTDHGFLDAMNGLRTAGLAFAVEGQLTFPADLVAITRQVLGVETSAAAARRLFDRVSSQVLAEVLATVGAKTGGSKPERIQRAADNFVQVSEVLAVLNGTELRELARDLKVNTSGTKDELADRVLRVFVTDRDREAGLASVEPPPPVQEPRALTPLAFDALLAGLRQQDLSDILAGIGASRVTGSKEQLYKLLRDSHLCEQSLLMELGSKQLEAALDRQRLKTSGSKAERIQRLLDWFASNSEEAAPGSVLLSTLDSPSEPEDHASLSDDGAS